MSLADRFREMFSSSSSAAPTGGRRRPRSQAQPVNSGIRSYDTEPVARPMARAQWIGLGLAAALAVALTAALVFVIMSVLNPGNRTAAVTPTPAPVVVSPTVNPNQSIAAIFGTFTPTPVTGPTATATVATGQRLQVANTGNDGVNLRRDPGSDGDRITTLREGTVLEVVGPDRVVDGDTWRNVRDMTGQTGWISASFLAPEGTVAAVAPVPGSDSSSSSSAPSSAAPAATPVPKPTSPGVAPSGATRGQVGNTGGQGANIRSEPGTSGKVLRTLNDGSNIEVLGPEKEVDGQIWRQVRDSQSGVVGWIIRGAVAPAGTIPTPVPPAAGPTRAPSAPAAGPTSAPAAGPTSAAPAAKPTSGSSAPAPAATAKPTTPPGDLPVIIQPATPRPTAPPASNSNNSANTTATPRP